VGGDGAGGSPPRPDAGTDAEARARRQREDAEAARLRRRRRLRDAVLLSGARAGIPLREGLQSLYRVQRCKVLAEGALFVLQFVLLILIVGDAFDTRASFEQEAAMANAILGRPLEQVESLGGALDWLEGTVVPGLWPTELYPGRPLPPMQRLSVGQTNRIVGPVELRVARVGNASCDERRFVSLGDRFDTPDGACFAEFVPGPGATATGAPPASILPLASPTEATAPYGAAAGGGGLGSGPYEWSLHEDAMQGELGFGVDTYGHGGYSVYLPAGNATLAAEAVGRVRAGGLLGRGTRALGVHVTTFNTVTRLLQSVRVTVEQLPSGLVTTSWTSGTARVLLYEDRLGIARGVAEALFCGMLLLGVAREARRVYHTHPRASYFVSAWNLYELANYGAAVALVAAWLLFVLNPRRQAFSAADPDPVPLWSVISEYKLASDCAGLLFVLSAAKLFKFLRALDKRMAVLWLTLQRSAYDVSLFMVGFLAVLGGFALAGVHLFGSFSRQFYSVPAAMATLLQFAVGEIDYADLSRARPRIAPWFTFLFVLSVSLLFANVLIAIVTLAFEDVNAEIQIDQTWQEGLPELTLETLMAARRCGRKVKRGCPCIYVVCCFCRARKASRLRREQRRRASALGGLSAATMATLRRGRITVQAGNSLAARAGLRESESLDGWMVRRLLEGAEMHEVRAEAAAVLAEDDRLRARRVVAGATEDGRSAVARAATGLSRTRSRSPSRAQPGSSRFGVFGETAAATVPCCGGETTCCGAAACFRRSVCCCCCSDEALPVGPSGRDLFEQPSSSDDDSDGAASVAASNAGRPRSVSVMNTSQRRALPTERTLFHAVRAEAEASAMLRPDKAAAGLSRRRSVGAFGSDASMQQRAWDAQEAFLQSMRRAARAARRRRQRSLDLFAYFQTAWVDSGGKTLYMSLQELCLVTSGGAKCTHESCVARDVVRAYQDWKAVILLRGEAKAASEHQAMPEDEPRDSFFVLKVNKAGRKQERVVVVDRAKGQLKGFDKQRELRRVLPLSQLVQIEQSCVDATRVSLVFADGVKANWSLLFVTPSERQRFCRLVYEVVTRKRLGRGPASPRHRPLRAGGGAFAAAVMSAAKSKRAAGGDGAGGSGSEAMAGGMPSAASSSGGGSGRPGVPASRGGAGHSRRNVGAPGQSSRTMASGVTAPWEYDTEPMAMPGRVEGARVPFSSAPAAPGAALGGPGRGPGQGVSQRWGGAALGGGDATGWGEPARLSNMPGRRRGFTEIEDEEDEDEAEEDDEDEEEEDVDAPPPLTWAGSGGVASAGSDRALVGRVKRRSTDAPLRQGTEADGRGSGTRSARRSSVMGLLRPCGSLGDLSTIEETGPGSGGPRTPSRGSSPRSRQGWPAAESGPGGGAGSKGEGSGSGWGTPGGSTRDGTWASSGQPEAEIAGEPIPMTLGGMASSRSMGPGVPAEHRDGGPGFAVGRSGGASGPAPAVGSRRPAMGPKRRRASVRTGIGEDPTWGTLEVGTTHATLSSLRQSAGRSDGPPATLALPSGSDRRLDFLQEDDW